MNQTQKNHAILRIRTIISKKLDTLQKTDRERFDSYIKSVSLSPTEIVGAITSGKATPFSKTKLSKIGSSFKITDLYDFSKSKEAKKRKLGITEDPVSNLSNIYFSSGKKDYQRGHSFHFKINRDKAVELIEKVDELEDTIMLSGDAEALAAIRTAEAL
jgi:hypothetical protein